MPSVQALGLDVNPSTDPLSYPGNLVTTSSIVVGSWLYRLHPRDGSGIGAWSVDLDGGPLGEDRAPREQLALDEALKLAGVSPVDQRHPVLAVGSNASPGQLMHKFSRSHGSGGLVPLIRARVTGLGVGHSAHVSKAGYIPYAPLAAGSRKQRDLFVLWLDAQQLLRLHETEPNYHWTAVSGDDFPAVLDSGESLRKYSLYRGRWGVLRIAPDGPPAAATTQADLFRLLGKQPWFVRLVPEWREGTPAAAAALNQDADRRARVREAMAREHLVMDDGITGSEVSPVSLLSPPRG